MKTRRVIISIEVESDASVEDLKACVNEALTDMVGMRECTHIRVEQIQANVVQQGKKKK